MDWIRGQFLFEQGYIKSLDEWSDDKERALDDMLQFYDYSYKPEKNGGFHFIDVLYKNNKEDDITRERRNNDELELHFNNIQEVINWLKENADRSLYG